MINSLKTAAAQAKLQPALEISVPIPAPPNSSIPWIVCLRSGATEQTKRWAYTVFFKDNELNNFGYSATFERCASCRARAPGKAAPCACELVENGPAAPRQDRRQAHRAAQGPGPTTSAGSRKVRTIRTIIGTEIRPWSNPGPLLQLDDLHARSFPEDCGLLTSF